MARGARLPLAALRDAGLGALEIELLLALGLVEEDPRFGAVFAEAQGGEQRRPTFGLLMAWWRIDGGGHDRVEEVRRALLELIALRLVDVIDGQRPRPEWPLAVPHALLDTLRGEAPQLPWLAHAALESLPAPEAWIAPDPASVGCSALAAAIGREPRHLLLVRGPSRNGIRPTWIS